MELVLTERELICFDDLRQYDIHCCSGVLWLTLPRDSRDHLLRPGMRFAIRQTGRVAISAPRGARLKLRIRAGENSVTRYFSSNWQPTGRKCP